MHTQIIVKVLYIILKAILLALVCHCSLDTRQEIYDLVYLPVLVRWNIERTPMKLKVERRQATILSGPWIRRIA